MNASKIVSPASIQGMTIASIAQLSSAALLMTFSDGSAGNFMADDECESTIDIKRVEGDVQSLVGSPIDLAMIDFEDVTGRPDLPGVNAKYTLFISTEAGAEVEVIWHGVEVHGDLLSNHSLVVKLESAKTEVVTEDASEETQAKAGALGDALAAAMSDINGASTPAQTVETASSEAGEPAPAEVAETEVPQAEPVMETSEEVAAEVPAEVEVAKTDWTYPVGEEHPLVMIYPTDTFPKEVFSQKRARWSPEDDQLLASMFKGGSSMGDLVNQFNRTPAALIARLSKLELVVEDHPYAARFAETQQKRDAAKAEKAAEAKAKQPVAA